MQNTEFYIRIYFFLAVKREARSADFFSIFEIFVAAISIDPLVRINWLNKAQEIERI